MIHDLEQLVLSGKYMAARHLFRQMAESEDVPGPQKALAYHMMSVVEAESNNPRLALDLCLRAEEIARDCEEWSLIGKTGPNLIGLYRRVGEHSLAMERGHQWLDELDRYPELAGRRGRVAYNLALVQRHKGAPSQALALLEQAVHFMAEAGETPVMRVMAHQMYAWTAYEFEDFATGDRECEQAHALIEPVDREAVREQLLLRGLRAYFKLEYQEVLETVQEFLLGTPPTTLLQQLAATWLVGMTAAKTGQLDFAREMAEKLQELCCDGERCVSTYYLNKASEILRRVSIVERLGATTEEAH